MGSIGKPTTAPMNFRLSTGFSPTWLIAVAFGGFAGLGDHQKPARRFPEGSMGYIASCEGRFTHICRTTESVIGQGCS